jgi:hypothetical protein
MTTDRELLELAAKAAGYEIDFEADINGWYPHGYDEFGDIHAWWNPLADDGDALRLAVELGIDIHIEGIAVERAVWADDVMLWVDGDALGATRRAIVMAAAKRIAEIGLSIQNGESGNG